MEQTHSFYDISQDIIHNKGRGLVVLLHGVPGVGKTSTAEAVAQKWKKPLLAITCGDLGLEATEVEKSLKEIFRLAQLWDCVLLLDEADVFISQRQPSDLQRNFLVSGKYY
jgi:SpoVK/Ycf46/Vps4 family AAA+-type ATPase